MTPIRYFIAKDLPDVLAIERASFSWPWSEEEFVRHLRQRNCIGQVVQGEGERVIGFMTYTLSRNWIELTNFAVHPEHRRRGLGRAMVAKLAAKLTRQRRRWLVADVREKNLAAQEFFGACGLEAICTLRRYEFDGEDAYRFALAAAAVGTERVTV